MNKHKNLILPIVLVLMVLISSVMHVIPHGSEKVTTDYSKTY
jgi:hypothetical protein